MLESFRIDYIDGEDMKYKTYRTTAESEADAITDLFNQYTGGDFDHQIIKITKEGKTNGKEF